MKCTANGSTITFSNFSTYGKPLSVWYRSIDGDAGTFTMQVDSGPAISIATAALAQYGAAIATNLGVTTAPMRIRYTVTPGLHTVTFTQTHSGSMSIVAIGTTPNTVTAAMPPVIVETILRGLGESSSGWLAKRLAYDTNITTVVTQNQADGLNVAEAFVENYYQATAAADDVCNYSDPGYSATCNLGESIHPNDKGHAEKAAAELSAMKIVPNIGLNPIYTAWSGIYNSNIQNLGCGSYESASTPTYAPTCWGAQVAVGSGVNGSTQLQIGPLSGGTTGLASVAIQGGPQPTLWLTSTYTNSTTGYTSLPGLSFTAAANGRYKVVCDLNYTTTVTATNIKFQWTGPTGFTTASVAAYNIVGAANAAQWSSVWQNGYNTGFDLYLSTLQSVYFPAVVTLNLINGSTAGTVQLSAALINSGGTVTVQPGASCSVTQ